MWCEARQCVRGPWIVLKLPALDGGDPFSGHGADGGDVEAHAGGSVRGEVGAGELEEARCGVEAPAILGVVRAGVVFLEVDKCACELDEAFKKSVVGARGAQPEVLQYIVGFVVFACVEPLEVARVARVPAAGRFGFPGYDGLHAFAFFHGGKITRDYLRQQAVRQARRVSRFGDEPERHDAIR
jgi:hypothetical protein